MFAGVEGARFLVVQEVLLEFHLVGFCSWVWVGCGDWWWLYSLGALAFRRGGRGVAEELAVLVALAGMASVMSSIAGIVVGMMPKSVHASLLRKRLSVLLVT